MSMMCFQELEIDLVPSRDASWQRRLPSPVIPPKLWPIPLHLQDRE
jgi:hypothetical protein